MTEPTKTRTTRSFGAYSEQTNAYKEQQNLLKLIDADYKAFKLYWEANHPSTEDTIQRLIDELVKLKEGRQ